MITRYAYDAPEYTRIIWADEAKVVWADRLSKISAAVHATELAAIGSIRAAGRFIIPFEQIPVLSQKVLQTKLQMVILGTTHMSAASYSARPTEGTQNAYYVCVAQDLGAARAFEAAWKASDDQVLGELLGYPPCCISFYKQIWTAEKWIDTTYCMAVQSQKLGGLHDPHTLQVAGARTGNILLRWLGLRYVPHLPCSFNCRASAHLGQHMREIMNSSFPDEVTWLDELLDAPMQWSQRFGLGELKHPLFKLSFKSDATKEMLVVNREGIHYPSQGARGLKFPYTGAVSEAKPLKFYRKPVDSPAEYKSVSDPSLEWNANGFDSNEAMLSAHAVILQCFNEHVKLGRSVRMLDLGCGNGKLLRELTTQGVGVERLAGRAHLAKENLVQVHVSDIVQFIEKNVEYWPLVLLMPGRLDELSPGERLSVLGWLKDHARRVIVYAYTDWLTKRGDFESLCSLNGLSLHSSTLTQNEIAAAAVVDVEKLMPVGRLETV